MIKRQRQPEASESWWFNTKTNEVEFGYVSAAPYRIGPFETKAEAEQALSLIAERAKRWAEEESQDQ